MNHLKFIQKAAVITLALLAGTLSKVNAQTCPTSNEVTVTVIPEATITIAGATTICTGGSATLTATTGGGTGTCTIQWQSFDGSAWNDISGQTGASLNVTGLTATTQYRATYTCSGSGCDPQISNSQTITVSPQLTVSTDLTDITQCLGGNDQLSVAVTGASGAGTITYTWYSSADGVTFGSAISGATSSTYTPTSATAGVTYYRVDVSVAGGSGCSTVSSRVARVEFVPELSISTHPSDLVECQGGTGTLTVTTTGGSGTFTYQWEESNDGSTGWTNVTAGSGGTTQTYTPPSTTVGTKYYRVIVDRAGTSCDAVTSNSARVEITGTPTLALSVPSITECVGGTLSATVTVSGSAGTLSYQWQQSPDGTSGWTNVTTGTGGTTATFTPASTTAGVYYYRVNVTATGSGCGSIASTAMTVTITEDLVVAALSDIDECVSGTMSLTATPSNGTGTISYQWEEATAATGPFTPISGETNPTFTPSSTTAGTKYYRVVVSATGNGCGAVTSNTSTVIVRDKPTLVTTVSSGTICVGGTVTLSTTQSGGSGTCTIQWQTMSGSTWTDIPGETNPTYTTPPLTATSQYRAKVTCTGNGCCNP